ncbi:MAG: ParB N-terminal domain-containing protein [Candidatus Geothermarchaeota archaeon]
MPFLNIYEVTYTYFPPLKLHIVPLDILKPHEEIIEALKLRLKDSLVKEGVLRDPIVADYERELIIDGSHRAAALKELGAKYIVIQHFDYTHDEVRIHRWFRVFRNIKRFPSELIKYAFRFEYESSLIDIYALYIIFKNEFYLLLSEGDLFTVADQLRKIERKLTSLLGEPQFVHEEELLKGDLQLKDCLVLGYRSIHKDEILQAFNKRILLPHKTTRHVVPYRVLGLNVPLSYLIKEDIEGAMDYLKRLKFTYIGKSIKVNGRYYAEHVYKAIHNP